VAVLWKLGSGMCIQDRLAQNNRENGVCTPKMSRCVETRKTACTSQSVSCVRHLRRDAIRGIESRSQRESDEFVRADLLLSSEWKGCIVICINHDEGGGTDLLSSDHEINRDREVTGKISKWMSFARSESRQSSLYAEGDLTAVGSLSTGLAKINK
jgi:hypothetical protein